MSVGGNFNLQVTFGSVEMFLVVTTEEGVCSAIDMQWVEERDAAKHSTIPWTAARTQTYLKLRIVSHLKTLGQGYISVCIFQNSLNGMLKT